uniref:mucin-12-like isoform X2 n=1 Tax=Oncorhynchus gorbuscha TaxID=8017 RepID=UPI001EAF2BD3|nr:mucin-12-like isoform X2 [Oncorhynchus gorbuscha]
MDLNQSNIVVLNVAQEELHLSAKMASRSTPHFKPPLTIIIPYGLKSWLECLCRAIFIEGPRQIPEFIAAYCVELLEFRERNPLMDTKDVTHLYQEIREANYVKDWIVCPVPQAAIDCCLPEETLSVSQRTNPRSFKVPSSKPMGEPDKQVQTLSSLPGETHHRTHPGDGPQSSPTDLGGQPSPAVEEEAQARPGSAVQSFVFQRAPSLDSLLEANHSQVLISAPTDDVIVAHSANLQETIVFRSNSRPYSGVSPRGSLTKIPSVGEVVKIGVNDTTEVMSDVVVFHQVPSLENLPCTPSALSNASLAVEETVDQLVRSREFLLENVVSGSPSIKMVASAAALQQANTEKVSSSEIVGVGAARRVSSVRMPSREESVGRTTETPKRYTSPQISLLSAHSAEYLKATYKPSTPSLARVTSAPCGEREAAATISPKSSLVRVSSVSTGERAAEPACKEVFSNVEETYTLPSTEDLLVSSTASVGRISPGVSAIFSKSVLSGRAFSEPEIVGAAHRGSLVRITSRQEGVGRRPDTLGDVHLSGVSPEAYFVSVSPVMFEEEDCCVIATHSALVKKAVKLAHSENISPTTSPSIDLAWEELLQTSASDLDKVALEAFEIVNQKLQCLGIEISELASNPVAVSQSLNTLSYQDLSHSLSAVEEFSTASARRSEGDISERETAEGEAISVREITPAVSTRCSASNVSERVPFEKVVLGAAVPSLEELSESPTALAFVGEASPAVSANDVLERAPSETAVVGAELLERHTTPKVPPQTSFVSAYSGGLMNATNVSPKSSLARIPSGYISEGVSPAVSAICPASDLPERASSETAVMDTAPRVIHSTPSMDELLVLPTSVDGFSPAVSSRSSRDLVDAAQSVSSVRIPSREESVGRTAETPERHTSPRVSPQTFSESATGLSSKPEPHLSDSLTESGSLQVIFNMEETYTTPSMGEISISASTGERAAESASREPLYMGETYKPPSMADLPGSPAAVGGISPAVSGRCSQSDMAEEAPSETAGGSHTSSRVPPKVPPQTSWSSATGLASESSLARVPSVSLSDGAKVPAQIDKTLSMEELLASPLYSQWAMSPAGSERVSSVRIPSREESVGRTAETPERYTSPGASPRVSPQTSLVSAHVVKSLSGTDISQQSSLPRIPSAPSIDRYTSPRVSQRVSPQTSLARIPSASSMEELLLSPSASVGRVSTAVSRRSLRSSLSERDPSETVIRYSESILSGRALSKTEVVDAAQRVSPVRIPSREESVERIPETCTSPRVSPRISPRDSPQSSLARIQSAPSMEEPLVSQSAAVGRVSPARSGVSLVMSLGISAANVVGPVCFKDVSQIMPTKTPENQGSASSVRIPSREESVGRTAETPERHTSPRVSPRTSPRVFPRTSRTSAHDGEFLSGTDISPQSSLPRIPSEPSIDRHTFPKVSQRVSSQSSPARHPSAPSMEELLLSPSASVGIISPAVSRTSSETAPSETVIRYFESDLSGRAFSETELVDAAQRVSTVRIPSREESVGRTPEKPERHTSPRVSPITSARVSPRFSPETSLLSAQVGESLSGTDIAPQSSLPGIPSAASIEELQMCLTASVERISPAVSRSSRSSLLESASSEKATIKTVYREESVERTAETTESHTTQHVSFRAPLATSKTRVLSDVAVLYRPSIAEGLCLEVLDTESDQLKTPMSAIAPSHTAAMETAQDTVRIPSRMESARREAETQTYFASGLLDNSTQVSGTSVRLHEEVTAHPTEVQQGTLQLGVSLGVSLANMVGPQNTQSQSVQTGPDYHGPPSHSVPIGAGRVTPDAQPAFEDFTNQVWTLYHLDNETEEGTLSTNTISQPPFNGSAFIRNFGSRHVLLAERSPSPQQSDPQSWCGRPRQQPQPPPFPMYPRRAFTPRSQSSTRRPPPQHPTILNLEISIPNYFLFLDGNQVSLSQSARSVPASMFSRSRSAVVRTDDPPGYLSFSVPMEMVSGGSGQDGQAQFLQVISDEGNTVYSPALIHIVTSEHTEKEDQEESRRWPTSAPCNW